MVCFLKKKKFNNNIFFINLLYLRHPIILEKGGHSITLLLTSDKGVGDYYCDFMPVVEETNWPVESLIDVSSLPGDQSWFAIIQLVILFKCLQAIVGPLYYNPEQVNG